MDNKNLYVAHLAAAIGAEYAAEFLLDMLREFPRKDRARRIASVLDAVAREHSLGEAIEQCPGPFTSDLYGDLEALAVSALQFAAGCTAQDHPSMPAD